MKTPAQIIADHYLIAALWADSPEGTNPRETRQAKRKALRIAFDFLDLIAGNDIIPRVIECHNESGYGAHPDCGNDQPWFAAMGHDLWLTSQGHGTGFCDRDELTPDLRDKLTQYAERFSHVYPEFYRGWLYLHGNDVLSVKG